ncbi:MAG: hypothetical protein IPL88_13745 [Rhizobiales bacterium]|nr:hypothetical protein [Hyphomicrobiales bacterium]
MAPLARRTLDPSFEAASIAAMAVDALDAAPLVTVERDGPMTLSFTLVEFLAAALRKRRLTGVTATPVLTSGPAWATRAQTGIRS